MVKKSIQHFNYNFLLFSLLFGVILYDYIQKVTGFSYIDEIQILILFIVYLKRGKKSREFFIYGCIALFYLIYSLLYPHNVKQAIYMDFIIQAKPYIAFYSAYMLNFNISEHQRYRICSFCKITALCLLPIGILGFGGTGIMNVFCEHARFATMLTILSFVYLIYSDQRRKDIIIAILICAIGLTSFRSKMFGFFTAYICILLLWKNIKINWKAYIRIFPYIIILLALILYAAKEKIQFYFIDGVEAENMFARPLLYLKSIEILNDYPVFGTGYGSYATFASGEYYSPIYIDYDLYLSPEIGKGEFISDTYFPVFAQFGYVGFALFVWFWVRRYKSSLRNFKQYHNEIYFKIVILIIIFFFIESIADSTLTHNRGAEMMMLLAITLNNRYDNLTNKLTH